jgi:glycosyltransferase involved in cell wall biosynthesis
MPKVSICLPNLNTAKYLPERLNSIFAQTYQDWELIVYDSFSDDGAWEIFQSYAKRDQRMNIHQGPREGIYAGFNSSITKAKGELIYIATSDDTMMPDCLEKMVAALDEHPECGLCQCALEIIDENSNPHPLQWLQFTLGSFAPEWVLHRHIRPAPVDGILHCSLITIYTSITQLLIRKSVFDKYGFFETQWGSVADFEWGMRVGLLESCIYIPDVLATWRIHPEQATGNTATVHVRMQILHMARVALTKACQFNPELIKLLPRPHKLFAFYEEQVIELGLKATHGRRAKIRFMLGQIIQGNRSAFLYLLRLKNKYSIGLYSQYHRLRSLIADFDDILGKV